MIRIAGSSISAPCSPRLKIYYEDGVLSRAGERARSKRSRTPCCYSARPVPTDHELLRLFDRSPIGMYRSDANGRLLLVNPAMVAMLGYDSVDEVLALDLNRDIYLESA